MCPEIGTDKVRLFAKIPRHFSAGARRAKAKRIPEGRPEVSSLLLQLLDKVGVHPEQAPRGRRRGGAPSKDPVPRSAGLQTCGIRRAEHAALESYATRPRRNSAQHDPDFEPATSQTPLPGQMSNNRRSTGSSVPPGLLSSPPRSPSTEVPGYFHSRDFFHNPSRTRDACPATSASR